ncbi:MAG: aromatic amino acid lyase [Actinomycetia bacterium]|nr:aromatic amino acid lyase [Actinomycetes bacterium]
MNGRPTVVLEGEGLSIEDIITVATGSAEVALDPDALERCRASRKLLEAAVDTKRVIYGVNTSFGPLCNQIIHADDIETLQHNLVHNLSAGLGDPLPVEIARAMLVVRLNSLIKGYSAVRDEVLNQLVDMINLGIAPYVPECGSVGASGDLVHLGHMALGLIGEGDLFYKGELRPAAEVFSEVGMTPLRLSFKEGLALLNGTSAMTALAAFAVADARRLLNVSCATAAFAVEIFNGIEDAFDIDLHRVKPHPGQVGVAGTVRALVEGSTNITKREDLHELIRLGDTDSTVFESDHDVQDVYSIRCTPQVLAPVMEAIEQAARTVEIEANSSNDNPLIFPENDKLLHGGNFHGQSIGFVMDMLCMAVSTMCNLSERRTNKYLDPNLNKGLPNQLCAGTVGLTMGLMGTQFVATSTTAEVRQLASPVSINNIPCNAANQDVVSMGTVAARKAVQATDKARHVLTVEVLTNLQALSFRNAEGLGAGTRSIYDTLNEDFSPFDDSRPYHGELLRYREMLFDTPMFDDLSDFIG